MLQSNRRHQRRVATAVSGAGVALVLGLAGCGTSPDGPTVASAESRPAVSANASTNALTKYVDGQRKWVACLRQQGFDVPDPDSKGFVDIGAFLSSAKMSKTDGGFVAAQEKCRGVQPAFPAELEPSLPPLTAQQLENRRKYSKCMRANGMPNWPDPGPNGEYPQGWESSLDPGSRPLTKQEQDANVRALQICDPVMDGRPPTTPDPSRTPQG